MFSFNSVLSRPLFLPFRRNSPFVSLKQHRRPIIIKLPSSKLHFCITNLIRLDLTFIYEILPCTATLYLKIRERARPLQNRIHVLHASKLLLPSRPTFQAKRHPQSTLQQFLLPSHKAKVNWCQNSSSNHSPIKKQNKTKRKHPHLPINKSEKKPYAIFIGINHTTIRHLHPWHNMGPHRAHNGWPRWCFRIPWIWSAGHVDLGPLFFWSITAIIMTHKAIFNTCTNTYPLGRLNTRKSYVSTQHSSHRLPSPHTSDTNHWTL